MTNDWTLILKDGSRHAVTADVSFEIVGRQKFAKGTIQGDHGVLFDAFTSGRAILESAGGHQHPVAITGGGANWIFQGVS